MEIIEEIYRTPSVRIERIVSFGDRSEDGCWYDQAEAEWVCVVSGWAILRFEGCSVRLQAGEDLLIPAHRRHRVEQTSLRPPCRWVCVFFS